MFKLMKRIKKSVLFVSLFVLVLNLLGCSVKKKEIDDINGESSIGEISDIYMRQALINEEKEQPINITRSDDGGIFVVTGDELSSENVWYVDENDNWEKKYDLKQGDATVHTNLLPTCAIPPAAPAFPLLRR